MAKEFRNIVKTISQPEWNGCPATHGQFDGWFSIDYVNVYGRCQVQSQHFHLDIQWPKPGKLKSRTGSPQNCGLKVARQ
jgi:hypothetical protein